MDDIRIAVDGPSGAGKSTLAKRLAKALGIVYLDTGAMYRAVGLIALEKGIGTHDEVMIKPMLDGIDLTMDYVDGATKISVGGRDITGLIRTEAVSMAASDVSSLGCVREKLVMMQREIAAKTSVVLDGRDIGTNVLPNADFKFFITAPEEVRARRRYDELRKKGADVNFESVLDDIKKRDDQDSSRAINPLRAADDAVIIETGEMDEEKVLAFALDIIRKGRR